MLNFGTGMFYSGKALALHRSGHRILQKHSEERILLISYTLVKRHHTSSVAPKITYEAAVIEKNMQEQLSITKSLLHRFKSTTEEIRIELLKASTGCAEPSNCSLIASNVTLMLALEFLHKVTHHAIVKVLPTQVGISSSRFHFKDAIFNGQNGNIKCATTQVKDQYILLTCSAPFFIQTIGNGSSRRLINDAQYVETCNGTCIFGGLTLGVIEVCRYSNYSTLDFATQVSLGYFLHFGQYHRGNFFRKEVLGVTLVLDLHLGLPSFAHHTERPVLHIGLHRRVIEFAANETLGIKDGIVRIHSHLILGCISDKPFSVRKGNVARCSAVALVVGDNLHFPVLENSDAGVRGAQVNAYGRRFGRHGCRNAIKISL
ncbi:hypothetical protein L345_01432, partial [Ophiophagus hannah]